MKTILIAEDDVPIANLIKINLTKAGYHCECADNGKDAADLIEQKHFDLALLDIMLPGLNGYELLEYAAYMKLPVIYVSALDTPLQKAKGLKLGAEDYISKPFAIVELLARVETVLRRYDKTNHITTVHHVTIDMDSHRVTKEGREIILTLKEYNLLVLLVRNIGIALSRETIYENVWNEEYITDSRTIDLHIQRLKKKLGWNQEINAVYKVGYRLEAQI